MVSDVNNPEELGQCVCVREYVWVVDQDAQIPEIWGLLVAQLLFSCGQLTRATPWPLE